MSWVEQFMNWYPRNTRLYRRRSKNDPPYFTAGMQQEFEELKPFFMNMANRIWEKAQAAERENTQNLCQAVLQCTSLEQPKAMARGCVVSNSNEKGNQTNAG